MFYLIKTLTEKHPDILKNINGILITEDSDFYNLLSSISDHVIPNEVEQAKASLKAIGTYFSLNCKYSIIDQRDLNFLYPHLIKK